MSKRVMDFRQSGFREEEEKKKHLYKHKIKHIFNIVNFDTKMVTSYKWLTSTLNITRIQKPTL